MSKEQKDNQTSDVDDKIAKAVQAAVGAAVKDTIVALEAMKAQQANASTEALMAAQAKRAAERTLKCPLCRQLQRACGGPSPDPKDPNKDLNHEKMIVGPSRIELWEWFQPVHINGVAYLSPAINTPVWVPKHNDIQSMISIWEENEIALKSGRRKQHFSGRVGPNGFTERHEAHEGWR